MLDNISISNQIAFIDSQVNNYQNLIAGTISNVEKVILDSDSNAIAQITKILSQRDNFTTIHLVAHGSPGCLYLGNTQLSLDTINYYAELLNTWFPSSLLIYGCNVAAGDAGAEFIQKLHQITGANIAASSTPIGNANLGGNWDLDVTTNNITPSLTFTAETQRNYQGVLNGDDNPLAEDLAEDLPTITTDLDDYAPGSTANITGENFEPGETVELQVLHTDDIPNTGGGHEPWQVTDGGDGDLDNEVNGTIITTWFVNPDDSAGSAFELTATGLTSGAVATHHFTDSEPAVQFFYVPGEEEDILTAIQTFITGTTYDFDSATDIDTVVSVTISTDNTVIYYDHWEDGYESDLNNPTQSSTEVWGDNNPDNGIPDGFDSDVLNAGDIVALENSVDIANTETVVDYDGRDKIGASKAIVVSRAAWPTQNDSGGFSGTLVAGAVEVYDTTKWGTEYQIPVGEDLATNSINSENFEYTGIFITASTNGTTLTLNGSSVDINGDTVVDSSDVLDQGETYFADGINTGDTFVASNPVQAQLLTGDVGSFYASRSYTLLPTSEWGNSYYTPVGTVDNDSDTNVFLYNPDPVTDPNTSIIVNYETQEGSGTIEVPAGQVVRHTLTTDSGARFYTNSTNDEFWAVSTFDSEASTHDWGFSLVPESNLTPIIQVGWGPGNGSTPPDANGSPLWVMATEATTLYIDYDGDGVAPNTDINGGQYDDTLSVDALEAVTITDTLNNDFNQSGIRVYTVDGTNLAAAWGQDSSATGAGTSLDLGTTVLPLPVVYSWKEFNLVNDVDGDGEVDPGDTIEFTINIENQGVVVLGNVNVSDIIPDGTTYVAGSKKVNGVSVGDDSSGTVFPLDDDKINNGVDAGKNIGNIGVGESAAVSFQVQVNDPYDGSINGITNSANVDSDEESFTVAVNFPIDQTGVQTKTLYLSATNDLDRVDPANSDPIDTSDSETDTLSQTINTIENTFDSDWTEIDDDGDFNNGNVIVSSGELQLDDRPNSGGEPGIERSIDLSGAISSTLSFDFSTGSGVDNEDAITLDITDDGGSTYTTLETFTGISGSNSGSRTYDLEDDITLTADTEIRFRVTNAYGGNNEVFSVDNINISSTTVGSETFTQSIPMRDSFTVDADGTISVTAYIDMSSGVPTTSSDIAATLEYGPTPTTLASLSNPTSVTSYDDGDAGTDVYEVTWTTTLASDTTIPDGDSVNLEITNNDANLDFTVLYDSDTYPSKIDLPTTTVIDITNIGIYDADNGNGNLITSATDGDTVYIRTTVTDPFGEQDITKLDLVITDPLGNTTTIDGNPTTIEVDDTDANTDNDSEDYDIDSTASDNTRIYEFPWTPTGNLGDYTIEITAHEGYETGNAAITDTGSTSFRLQDTIIPDIIIGDASVIEGNQLVFDVSLLTTETTTSDIVLDLAASTETSNTATAVSDYETTTFEYSIDGGTTWISAAGSNGTQVTIPAGSSGIKVRIDSISDTTDEPDETFTLGVNRVVSGSVGDTSDTGTGTILDDDANPSISIDDVSLTEGNLVDGDSFNKEFTFTVSLSNASSETITVNYVTDDDTATTANSDYTGITTAQTITFNPGETEKTITVLVAGDDTQESDETFNVNLTPTSSNIDSASSDLQGVGTILNDDNTPIFSISDFSEEEGNSGTKTFTFTVTRSGNTSDAVTIDYATADNTATTGDNDYESASGTLTFGTGITTQTISVTVNGDTPPEGDDTFFVNLFNAVNVTTPSNGATISDSQGIGTIVNDDASGTISGNVKADTNNDNTADSPLSGVTIELLDENGNSIDSDKATSGVQPTTTTTDSNGDYEFTNVAPGDYQVRENDPDNYISISDGDSTNASDDDSFLTNTDTNDNIIPVTVSANEVDSGNDFIDEPAGSISGEVLADTNNDDIGDSPLADVTIELLNGNGDPIDSDPNTSGVQPTTTTTNANGGYSFTNLAPGDYQVQQTNLNGYSDVKDLDTNVDGNANGTDGNTDQNLIDVELSPGENSTGNDFVDERGVISGNVTEDTDNDNDGEDPLANVTIELLDSGNNVVATTTTDASGNYSFTDLEPDTYTVRQTDFSGYDSVIDNDEIDDGGTGGSDDDTNSDPNNNELTVALAAGEEDTGNNFVDRVQSGVISGQVLEDTTGNGIGDSALSGVTVTLKNGSGNDIDSDLGIPGVQPTTTTTASDGTYSFTGLADGNYQVVETNLSNYTDVSDIDGNSNGDNTIAVTLSGSSIGNDFVDEALQTGSIRGTVTADTDGDGVGGDSNLSGVTLSLLDSNGSPVLNGSGTAITTTTNTSGEYTFSNLPPGDYQVVETDPSGYSSVTDEDSDDSDDSNSNTNDNILTISLSAGENDSGNDFVDQQNGTVSGQVLEDTDNDNSGDDPISGVTLTLKDINGNTVATTTTNSSGNYTFSDVTPGDYTVEETDPSGYSSVTDEDSVNDGGNDGEINSDGVNDNTISVSLLPNETDSGNDFVDEQNTATGTISGKVTLDTIGGTGISGVTIKLFNEDGTVEIDNTTTDINGDYSFNNVNTGISYQVQEINNAGYGDVSDTDGANDNIINVNLTSTDTSTGNNFVDAQSASISGRIWADANSDDLDNNNEAGVNGLTVILIGGGADKIIEDNPSTIDIDESADNTSVTQTTINDGTIDGTYSFTGLNPGEEYQVTFPTSTAGYSGLTDQDQGGDDAIDSDANTTTGKTDVITLAAGEVKINVDAGLVTSAINLEGTNISEDSLEGGSSNETIAGLKGQDTLTGDGGSDTFFFNETSEGVDVITDFTAFNGTNSSESDKIDLSQILADEVTNYTSGDPFAQGYVLLTEFPTLPTASTMVQIDFDAGGDLLLKSLVLLENVAVNDLDTTENFII